MTIDEIQRLNEIEYLMMDLVEQRSLCLREDDLDQLKVVEEALLRLDRERLDIKTGLKPIMNERKEYLLNRLTYLNEEVEHCGFFRRFKLMDELNTAIDELAEHRLRKYAEAKVKKKSLDK